MGERGRIWKVSVSCVLTSVRVSFERSLMAKPADPAALRNAMQAFDDVRYDFHALDKRPHIAAETLRSLFEAARSGLQSIFTRNGIVAVAAATPFKPLWIGGLHERFEKRYAQQISVAKAAELLIEDLEWGLSELTDEEPGAETLKDILPEQTLAPLTFEIVNDVLTVVRREPRSDPEDARNVLAARDALLAGGDRTYNELSNTNCDRRLLECIADLNGRLKDGSSIIFVGLANINLTHMTKAYADELPDPVQALLTGHTLGVRMYVSQFGDWVRFSEKAALAEMTQPHQEAIGQATDDVVASLNESPEVAEAEIPKTLAFLRRFSEDPTAEAKRVSFALLRTLENLCICVFQYGEDFLRLTAEKVKASLATGTARVAVVTLLSLAVYAAATLTPVASTVSESQWLPRAFEIAKKHLEELLK